MPHYKRERESEKLIERRLREYAKLKRGMAIKLLPNFVAGIPDRLLLLPPGIIYFVELKSSDGRLSRIQQLMHIKIKAMGFKVYVVQNRVELEALEREYEALEASILRKKRR